MIIICTDVTCAGMPMDRPVETKERQIAKFAVRGYDLPRALLYLSAQNI